MGWQTVGPYIYLFGTVAFTVYAQLVIKWRVASLGTLPEGLVAKLGFMARAFMDPWLLSAFGAAFFSAVFWIAAMTKFQVSYAYPIVVGLLILVTTSLAVLLLGETVSPGQAVGIVLILSGLALTLNQGW